MRLQDTNWVRRGRRKHHFGLVCLISAMVHHQWPLSLFLHFSITPSPQRPCRQWTTFVIRGFCSIGPCRDLSSHLSLAKHCTSCFITHTCCLPLYSIPPTCVAFNGNFIMCQWGWVEKGLLSGKGSLQKAVCWTTCTQKQISSVKVSLYRHELCFTCFSVKLDPC